MLCVPVLVYIGFGGYALWQTGLFRWTWWIVPGCWVLTFGVARIWPARTVLPEDEPIPQHWTPQDEAAMKIVSRYQQDVEQLSPAELTDIQFYLDTSQKLARSLAEHYHPKSPDMYSSLTVLEVLAAIRLAVEDLEVWFHDHVPGSHLVTIGQWKLLGKAPQWARRIGNVGWLASIALNPMNVAKYFSSKVALDPLRKDFQAEVLAVVYLRFVRLTGFYLVEMYSGRLRRGADRYRSAFGRRAVPEESRHVGRREEDDDVTIGQQQIPESIVIAAVGQVKSGKSSVINAMLGNRETVVDVLPHTKTVSRHTLDIPETDCSLTLLDTPGYSDADMDRSARRELEQAVDEADVILLVVDGHTPSRAADVEFLEQLEARAKRRPRLVPPPVIVGLTHIDLLSPMMQWQPPYDWESPTTAKEESIRDAVQAVTAEFGSSVKQVVPVCTDLERGREYNIQNGLIAALASVVDAGKTAALVKAYEKQLDADRFSALLKQVTSSGKTLWNVWRDERAKSNPE